MPKRNDTRGSRAKVGGLPALALLSSLTACTASVDAVSTEADRRAALRAMIADNRDAFPDVPTLDAAAVERHLRDQSAILVDAREPEERAVSTIPGSLAAEEFERQASELRGRKVITYCTVGHRSAEYTRWLLEDGWDAVNFAGSILAWTHAGGELVDPEGNPTRRVHVYGERWNLAADGYETVW